MKKTILIVITTIITSVLLTGCATLFGGGSKQPINIQSNKEMLVNIYKVEELKDTDSDNEKKAPQLIHSNIKIPTTISVDRESKDILIKPVNEECQETRIEHEMNDWVWGDIIATSLASTTTDALTGAMWKYDENTIIDCQ